LENLFDDANAPETEPAIIVAGDQNRGWAPFVVVGEGAT